MKETILVVDDELIVRRTIGDALRRAGYNVELCDSGDAALERLSSPGIDLLLLDLQLGDIDGAEIMRAARQYWPDMPIVMLTAHGSLPSAIAAVHCSVADYLLKPISIEALRERITTVLAASNTAKLRREQLQAMYQQMRQVLEQEAAIEVNGEARSPEQSALLISGPLRLDARQHTVLMDGRHVLVTPSEFAILTELLHQPGSVVTCLKLARATNTAADDEEEARQLIRPHIARLRRKLEADPQQPCYLISVRGVGYRWVGEPAP